LLGLFLGEFEWSWRENKIQTNKFHWFGFSTEEKDKNPNKTNPIKNWLVVFGSIGSN